jgi:hypothetical protein
MLGEKKEGWDARRVVAKMVTKYGPQEQKKNKNWKAGPIKFSCRYEDKLIL